MRTLNEQLAGVREASKERIPETSRVVMRKAADELKASDIEGRALGDGERVPDFTLPNPLGEARNLKAMLREGPVVISFYRGGW